MVEDNLRWKTFFGGRQSLQCAQSALRHFFLNVPKWLYLIFRTQKSNYIRLPVNFCKSRYNSILNSQNFEISIFFCIFEILSCCFVRVIITFAGLKTTLCNIRYHGRPSFIYSSLRGLIVLPSVESTYFVSLDNSLQQSV